VIPRWLSTIGAQLVDAALALALYLRADRSAAPPDPSEARIDVATAAAGLEHVEALAHIAEIDQRLRVANYEAYLRLMGASLLAWIVGNQLGTPDLALEALAASIAALIFVLVSTVMQALWAEGIALRGAIEQLAGEIDDLRNSRSDEERSLHFRRAAVIVNGRLERAIRAGERSTARTRRVAWALGQVPWFLAAVGGTTFLVVAGASLLPGSAVPPRSTASLIVYGVLWTWAGYTIRLHFAPRRADLRGASRPEGAAEFLSVMRRARRAGVRLTVFKKS
jgi:hypothetical protein